MEKRVAETGMKPLMKVEADCALVDAATQPPAGEADAIGGRAVAHQKQWRYGTRWSLMGSSTLP